MNHQLPGGLLIHDTLLRDFCFKPITGEIERALNKSMGSFDNLAQQVTEMLSLCLDEVAGQTANKEWVCRLSMGDRLFLITQLHACFDPEVKWINSICSACEEIIQFEFEPGKNPIKAAGQDYPEQLLELSVGKLYLRVPNGYDEQYMASRVTQQQATENAAPLDHLLARLLSDSPQENHQHTDAHHDIPVHALSENDRQIIDKALDEMMPQVAVAAHIQCPHCQHEQEHALDPYTWMAEQEQNLDIDVHLLATHYHWSERDILSLSREQRYRYLRIIERSQGRYTAEDMVMQQQGIPVIKKNHRGMP